MAVPRSDLETGERRGKAGGIGVNNRGSWGNANAAKTRRDE